MCNQYQDLKKFRVPTDFRGRNKFIVQLWWIVQKTLFKNSPRFANSYRVGLLRLFGAKIEDGVLLRPSVTVTYPWKIKIGKDSWIGENVTLYSLGNISIGNNVVISQNTYICGGYHDYKSKNFEIVSSDIQISDEVWIATDVYISPGVSIGKGSVIGARSSVFSDINENLICYGSPCKPIKKRI